MLFIGCGELSAQAAKPAPNVLFISIDDLNDWIGCLGGHPQSMTPNFDRLAKTGVLFTNAHCPAPSCNPSRSAIMSGLAPNESGLYHNLQNMREVMPDEVLLPKYFSDHGYWSAGSGKLLHYVIDARSWDEYYPNKKSENPFPKTLMPPKRPVTLPVGGPWQYSETDWGGINASDKDAGGDYLVADYVGKHLRRKHEKPFFLACGIYRPHEPWFVPQKYFDKFPLDQIQLPPGYKKGDLDDVPKYGQKLGPNRYFAHIQKQGQWKQAIQGYLASINYADAMLGKVLDSLEAGPNKENTIVVLWSDHGWHLGEKQHWQKYTGWRQSTRVPLMVKVPSGISSALPNGVEAGRVCDQPVSLMSLFPSLTELCGLPAKPNVQTPSLLPLLKGGDATWSHVAVTYLDQPKSYAVSAKDWRYIHYTDGGEELYHIPSDRYEWKNLADKPEHQAKLEEMRQRSPKDFVGLKKVGIASLPTLDFVKSDKVPKSVPSGGSHRLVFVSQAPETRGIYSVEPNGMLKLHKNLKVGEIYETKTKPGALWVIKSVDESILGYFKVNDRRAKAVVD